MKAASHFMLVKSYKPERNHKYPLTFLSGPCNSELSSASSLPNILCDEEPLGEPRVKFVSQEHGSPSILNP